MILVLLPLLIPAYFILFWCFELVLDGLGGTLNIMCFDYAVMDLVVLCSEWACVFMS